VISFTPSVGLSVTADIDILGYGCIYQSGYLFSIDDTTPNTTSIGGIVAGLTDTIAPSPGIVWSPGGDDTPIWGIGHSSQPANPTPNATSPFPAAITLGQANCSGANDGLCNTHNIVTFFAPGNTYAAGVCDGIVDGSFQD
jgi:hypothetical protein